MVAGVLVEITNKNVDKEFDYLIPDSLSASLTVGMRVLVPFGNMKLEGFVVRIKDVSDSTYTLKEIIDIVDMDIVLNEELLLLGKKMRDKTLASLVSCYQVMLPKGVKASAKSSVNIKYVTHYILGNYDSNIKFNDKQLKIIDFVLQNGSISRSLASDISLSSLNTLVKKKVLIPDRREDYRVVYKEEKSVVKQLTLEQKNVVNEVINNRCDNYLLYGVTGSGKTEVYMEIINYYLEMGKTSIVLVPEISLTPQMINRFQMRFGKRIAALHSGLSVGEKYDEYRRIYRGEASIVIGARSAIFAPLNNIGVIIVDEEHSDSYKQSDPSPRYNAKDIALIRGEYHSASVIFGSATPSLEVMARARKKVFKLLSLPHRINGKALPKIDVIDMNREIKFSKGHFSNKLIKAIEERLINKEQVILFLNRRGYSSFVSCKNCGYTFKCPNCDISLTYHKSSNTLRCHYCGHGEKVYTNCPKCKEKSLTSLGIGTEKIEEELNNLFPNSRVLRMDYDTTSRKGRHEAMIEAFRNCEYDILLGTQMVAKGLDFANVTLVGVINADTSLNIPDFRSSENTFSLLSQVAGRSGRSEKEGNVIIQTFNPEHYAIYLASIHDYLTFFNKEMDIRHKLKYPPYYYLCNIRVSGKDNKYVFNEAIKIKNSLERNLDNMIILGPNSSTIFKINNIFRYNIIVKYKKDEELYLVLQKIVDHYKNNSKVKVDIDFNPSQMI